MKATLEPSAYSTEQVSPLKVKVETAIITATAAPIVGAAGVRAGRRA